MENLKDSLPALEIDVATWRRDIQTFVDATIDELTAINEQLASQFSGSSGRRHTQTPELAADRMKSGHNTPTQYETTGVHPSRTDERLNSLKRKLAAKLSGNGQGSRGAG